MEKGDLQRLKKSKKFAFGNSQFTRQHNSSLSGTNKYRSGRGVGFKFDEKIMGKVRWNN